MGLVQKRFYISLTFFILLSLMFGCAAQQGGAPEPTPEVVERVVFTEDNSQAVALVPFYLVSIHGDSNTHAWNLTLATAEDLPVVGLLKPNKLLISAFAQVIQGLKLQPGEVPTDVPSDLVPGCQGGYAPQLSFSPDGTFSGVLDFKYYSDDCDITYAGSPAVKGLLDKQTGDLIAEFDLTSLQVILPEKQYRVEGDVELSMNAYQGAQQSYSADLDLSLTDQSRVSYRLDEMKMVWNRIPEDNEVSLDGKLFFSELGLIDVVTESPLVIDIDSGLPYNGVIKFYGQDQTWVRLMFHRITYPGAFRINGSDGFETKGTLAPAQYEK